MFKVILFDPIFNLTIGLYKILGDNLALSIIAIAIISRLITLPILVNQMKSNEKIQSLKPKLDKIKKKYKDNKEKLNEATLKLYKEMGVNPLGGCLPMIVQLIFLVQVRNVVVSLVDEGVSSFNDIAYFDFLKFPQDYNVNLNFLGITLDKVAANFSWSNPSIIPYVVLAIIVGLTQLISTKILTPALPTVNESNADKKNEDEPSIENMSTQMSKQMTFLFPIITVIMALGYSGSSYFSAAMSIFWITQNMFVIIQRLVISPSAREELINKFSKIKLLKK
jgi:YidC/Oxa1 family membrane protein insertase